MSSRTGAKARTNVQAKKRRKQREQRRELAASLKAPTPKAK